MADQTLAALRELTEAVMAEFFGNDTNLSKRLIAATNEAQLLLMVQPPDDDRVNQPAPVEPGRVERLPDGKPCPTPPAEGEVGEGPTDEELGLIYHDCCGGSELMDQVGFEKAARAVLARFGNHFPGTTEMVAPPAEGEAHLLAAWMYRLADERTRNRRRGIRPTQTPSPAPAL